MSDRPRFRSARDPAWPVHSTEMLALLGVTRIPPEGLNARLVQGIWVWADPLPAAEPGQRKRSTHRVRCECPLCGKHLSAGRLHQHICS